MRWAAIGVSAIAAVLVGSACSPGAPTAPNSLAGTLTTRTVSVQVSGSSTFSALDAPAVATTSSTGFAVTYNNSSQVVAVKGALSFDTSATTFPTLTLDLSADVLGVTGRATLADPASGLSVSANGTVNGFAVDDLGNVAGSVTQSGRTISFSTSSVALPSGTDPALEALLAEEADFCRDAQQRLAGLDPDEVPLASIGNTREPNRAAFASSKAELSPLTTRTWTDATDVRTTGGDHATISQRISCKTRAADHVATTGVSTASSDAPCSTLNQRSIDLALAQMTPAQAAAVTLPNLGPDVVRRTGAQWTTPLSANTEFSANTLRSHALLTEWTDPAFVIFPDTIRGVHYCTTWSPAYAYAYLLSTI